MDDQELAISKQRMSEFSQLLSKRERGEPLSEAEQTFFEEEARRIEASMNALPDDVKAFIAAGCPSDYQETGPDGDTYWVTV